MIDLERDRGMLLEAIGVRPDALPAPGDDPTRPAFLEADVARVRLAAGRRSALFPLLRLGILTRFRRVGAPILSRDLFVPLRRAIGNASKRGHGGDSGREIRLEAVATAAGLFLAVEDQGAGFDAADVLRRFRARERYFEGQGSGFSAFETSAAHISFANGGRSWLLGWVAPREAATANPPSAAAPDPDALASALAAAARRLGLDRSEAWRLLPGAAEDVCDLRLVLPSAAGSTILAGRWLPAPAADVDWRWSRSIHAAHPTRRGLHVAHPISRGGADPAVLLYAFDPWMDLRSYLSSEPTASAVSGAARRAGIGLAALHGSSSAPGPPAAGAPVHGGCSWQRILRGSDSRFYLHGFELAHRDAPEVDLAAWLGDLAEFCRARPALQADAARTTLLETWSERSGRRVDTRKLERILAAAGA